MIRSAYQKRRKPTLTQYVRRRNGVPLGAPGSLSNMLRRSLGAGSFSKFWQYWNPVWGYYLGWYIYAPLKQWMPSAIALIATFVFSGALHDAVISVVRGSMVFIFTPWFFVAGTGIVIGQTLQIDYSKYVWPIRAAINLGYISLCLAIALAIK